MFQPVPAKASARLAYDPMLLKAEVLHDRAGFSPGVIDGKGGTNLQHALEAFAVAHGLTSDGSLDAGTWNALTAADAPRPCRAMSSPPATRPDLSSARRQKTTSALEAAGAGLHHAAAGAV